MSIESVVAIASLCITILGCSWHLSSKLERMNGNMRLVDQKLSDHIDADHKKHDEIGDTFRSTDARFNEVFSQIRNMMTTRFDRS